MRTLTRREFHALVAAGAAAALTPGCAAHTEGAAEFAGGTATLSFAKFPSLKSAGGSAVVEVPTRFPLVVVRTAADEAVALSATCTHAWCIMSFEQGRIHCDCHDANFALDGRVLSGPTRIPIPVYAATVNADAIVVQIDDA